MSPWVPGVVGRPSGDNLLPAGPGITPALLNVADSGGAWSFMDYSVPNYPARFYRSTVP